MTWTLPATLAPTPVRSSNITATKRKGSQSQTKGRARPTTAKPTSRRRITCSEVSPTWRVAISPIEATA